MGIKKDREEHFIREAKRAERIIFVLFILGAVLTFKSVVVDVVSAMKNLFEHYIQLS